MAEILQRAHGLEAWFDERCVPDRQFGLLSHRVRFRVLQKIF